MANDLVKVRGRFTPDLVEWIVNPESDITETLELEIDKLLTDRRRRVQVFLTALVRRHVERIIYLMGKFPQIEEELFADRRIKSMKNSDLIRLLGIVGDQVEDASDFLQRFVSVEDLRAEPLPARRAGAQLDQVEEDSEVDSSEEEQKALAALPAESRKNVMRIFRKLISVTEIVEKRVEEDTVSGSEVKK